MVDKSLQLIASHDRHLYDRGESDRTSYESGHRLASGSCASVGLRWRGNSRGPDCGNSGGWRRPRGVGWSRRI